ncbi:hypothetical protein [Sphingomonas sp.]|uniref:hypothetical protein n=1 Tax=Sphingomonas sp. TaxID=28214 RepID=UPI003D6CC067
MIAALFLAALASQAAPAQPAPAPAPQGEPMACTIGPVERSFGGSDWAVFACSDGKSAVVLSKPGSPAAPFFFAIQPRPDGHFDIAGEGTGNKALSEAAGNALRNLGKAGLAQLVADARAAAKKGD